MSIVQHDDSPPGKRLKTFSGKFLSDVWATDDVWPVNATFLQDLRGAHIGSFFEPNFDIVYCWRTDKVADIWESLITHKFSSMPVFQKSGHKWFAFLTVTDVVHWLCDKFAPLLNKETEDSWKSLNIRDAFSDLLVNDVIEYPRTLANVFHPVEKKFSMLFVMELMAKTPGLYHVPVIDEDRKLVNLVTESALVQFLLVNLHHIGPKTGKPLNHCSHVLKRVVHVRDTSTALDALRVMLEHKLQDVAVTNADGKLVGNMSVADAKGVGAHLRAYWRFHQTVSAFLQHVSLEYGRPSSTAISLSMHDTVGMAIIKLATHRVHHLFVVNSENVPVGVCSLKDILAEVLA